MKPVQETIGTILTEDYERDAIHIAMFPVISTDILLGGDSVALESYNENGVVYRVSGSDPRRIGIVDPFLDSRVNPGQKFWVFLLPNTVTSLRHDWTHPAFNTKVSANALTKRDISEAWLRQFLDNADCPGYDVVMKTIENEDDSWDADYLHFSGYDAHGDIPSEFWTHVENVLGYSPKNKPSYFSCSC